MRGENSPLKFLIDFLFSSLIWVTYLAVLETIKSLVLGSKLGHQEDDSTSKPENRGNDPLDKMSSGSVGFRYENSMHCGLI